MILHFCSEAAWRAARESGGYRGDTLADEGFIHCSTAEQLHIPANFLIHGRTDQVLLEIDEAKLEAELRWEPGSPDDPQSMKFPHVYGPLNLDAIVAVHPFPPGEDGTFTAPHALLRRNHASS